MCSAATGICILAREYMILSPKGSHCRPLTVCSTTNPCYWGVFHCQIDAIFTWNKVEDLIIIISIAQNALLGETIMEPVAKSLIIIAQRHEKLLDGRTRFADIKNPLLLVRTGTQALSRTLRIVLARHSEGRQRQRLKKSISPRDERLESLQAS
jgi:hypothetical protein